MIELSFENNLLNYRQQLFSCIGFEIQDELFASVNIINSNNDCWVLFQSNMTIINGVIQTSAQMIIDTLTNA